MAKDVSIIKAINVLAERTYDNTRDISQKNKQRRTKVVDLYGIEYTRQGAGSGSPATFYISVSPDLVYYQRFQFKLILQPFETAVASGGIDVSTTGISINNRSLSINNNSISPNPHNHGVSDSGHTHAITQGITYAPVDTNDTDYFIEIEGIDVTPYLIVQGGNEDTLFESGEGVYPSTNINLNYDVLEIASDMVAEDGEESVRAETLLKSGYKKVKIWNSAGNPFRITLVNYLKYSHINR